MVHRYIWSDTLLSDVHELELTHHRGDALNTPVLKADLRPMHLSSMAKYMYSYCQYCGTWTSDVVVISLQMQYSKSDGGVAPRYDEGEDMVRQLQSNQTGMDDRLHQSQINLFSHQQPLTEGLFDAPNGELSLRFPVACDYLLMWRCMCSIAECCTSLKLSLR